MDGGKSQLQNQFLTAFKVVGGLQSKILNIAYSEDSGLSFLFNGWVLHWPASLNYKLKPCQGLTSHKKARNPSGTAMDRSDAGLRLVSLHFQSDIYQTIIRS